jgi:hypothetical protein
MLNELSWGDYLAAVGLLLALYYTGVGILYYREEIKNLLSPKQNTSLQGDPAPISVDEAFEGLEAVAKKVDSILERAGKGASKTMLLPELKQALANYGGLRIPAYKAAVFNHIIHQAKEICGAGISAQELEG